MRLSRFGVGWSVAAWALIADQATKAMILYWLDLPTQGSIPVLPFFSLTMVWNTGVSMGMQLGQVFGGADAGRLGLIILTAAITLYLMHWLRRAQGKLEKIGLGLIIGGAVGNLVDRIAYGAVADFIHLFGFGYHFYVFNVADAAITIGVILLLTDSLLALLHGRGKSPKNTADPVQE